MYKIIRKTAIFNNLFTRICVVNQSTKPAIKEPDDFRSQIKVIEKIARITPKFRTKEPQRPPFVKNLLLGKFDTEVLAYPQLTKEELKEMEQILEPVKKVLQQPELRDCTEFNLDFLQKLSKNELIGLQAVQSMGGRELSVREMCRFFEHFANLKLNTSVVNSETLPIQALLNFGNDYQKSRYLSRLINGEAIAAFCVVEAPSTSTDLFEQVAASTQDNKIWVLNGNKNGVINGSSADFFVVVTPSDVEMSQKGIQQKLSAFIIDRDSGGIISKKVTGSYLRNVEVSNVTFENVQIPAENILGTINQGETVLSSIFPLYRLSTAPICSTISRNLIDNAIKHFIKISHGPFPLYERDAIRSKIGEYTMSLYAVESVIYLTSGLMDAYENQDVEMETTIAKVFASEQALNNTISCMDLLGVDSLTEGHWCNQLHAEALKNVVLNDTNDSLKMIIALFGLQFAGRQLEDLVRKMRNPFFHAFFVAGKIWQNQKNVNDKPKLHLNLHYELHKSLKTAAEALEYCVLRLQFATETLLSRHGQEVVNRHMKLRRLADCIIDIYAMTACISRASRSYCIGLQHADLEINMAISFCFDARERVRKRVAEIYDGEFFTNDENLRKFAKDCFHFKQYFPVHALSRNF